MEGGSGYFAIEDTSTVRGSSVAEVDYSPGARQIAVRPSVGHCTLCWYTILGFPIPLYIRMYVCMQMVADSL